MRTSSTRFVLLGLLTEQPLAGYDIKKIVNTRFHFFWSESYGQIYPELKRMTQEGLVELLPEAEGSGARPKKLYRITSQGRAAFQDWMEIRPEAETQRFEFLLKIYWAQWLPAERVGDYVRDFAKRHGNDLEMLRRMETEIQGILNMHPNHWWILQTIRLGRRINEAYVGWAAELLNNLEGMGDED